jgi:capsule biosynthesis phosphatase
MRLVFDLDGTLAIDEAGVPYPERRPDAAVVARLREYRAQGCEIVIHSARNMRTFANSVGHINAVTLPVIVDWLRQHDIPFDEIHVGKPWCGEDGFYVDDKAIRPSELLALSRAEIAELLDRERRRGTAMPA